MGINEIKPDFDKIIEYYKIAFLIAGSSNPALGYKSYFFATYHLIETLEDSIEKLIAKRKLLHVKDELIFFSTIYKQTIEGIKHKHRGVEMARTFFSEHEQLINGLEQKKINGILFKSKQGNINITDAELIHKIKKYILKNLPEIVNPETWYEMTTNGLITGKKSEKNSVKKYEYACLKNTKPLYHFIKENSSLTEGKVREFIAEFMELLGFPFNGLKQPQKEARIESAHNNQ